MKAPPSTLDELIIELFNTPKMQALFG